MLKKKCKELIFLIPTIIHYLIAFFMTLNFQKINEYDHHAKVVFVIIEILFFIVLVFIYKKTFEIFKDKRKFEKKAKYIKTFLIYFGILFFVLLLVWPGVWRADDVGIVELARSYGLLGWYSILSSLFCIFSFKFIPNYVGVVIVQCVFISIIVSYSINKIYDFFNFESKKYKIILYIPFLLFPVIDNNLYPWRCTWSAYLILFSLIKIVDCYRMKKLEWKYCLELSILFGILSSLRNEQVYFFMILIIMFLYFLFKKKIKFTQFFVSIVVTILLTITVYGFNNFYNGNEQTKKYDISGTINGLKVLVKEAYNDNRIDILNDLDSLINVDLLLTSNTNTPESELFWSGMIKEDKIDQNYDRYMKAVIKLNLNYPRLAISSRIASIEKTYHSTGISPYDSSSIYDKKENLLEEYKQEVYDMFREETKTLNSSLRKRVIRFLEGLSLNDFYEHTIIYKMWYLNIPLIISLIFMVYLLLKKKNFYFLIYFSVFLKSILVFFTQPAFLFAYFFNDYIMGYLSLSILILIFIDWLKKKKQINKVIS